MIKSICFDMDGTIADLYGSADWLEQLMNEHTKPYRNAKPLVDMRKLGKELNRLQKNGWSVNVISWLCKNGSVSYNEKVTQTKIKWLKKHLGAVKFDTINIVEYGTPKHTLGNGILFDDEEKNRNEWRGTAYNVNNIIEVLKGLNQSLFCSLFSFLENFSFRRASSNYS